MKKIHIVEISFCSIVIEIEDEDGEMSESGIKNEATEAIYGVISFPEISDIQIISSKEVEE